MPEVQGPHLFNNNNYAAVMALYISMENIHKRIIKLGKVKEGPQKNKIIRWQPRVTCVTHTTVKANQSSGKVRIEGSRREDILFTKANCKMSALEKR